MNEPEINELLVEYINFYEKNQHSIVQTDSNLLDFSKDLISDFIEMLNESLAYGQREKTLWLILRYGTANNFKLLFEWINHSLATSDSVSKQDNLAQSQENIISFLLNHGALKISDIHKLITVLKRREVSGFSDRPRKLLEFHLQEIQNETTIEPNEQPFPQTEIDSRIKDFFSFMRDVDLRKHKLILSSIDFDRLISWVSFYFQNDLTVPEISIPIKTINTAKRNVIFTFMQFFKTENPSSTYPDSLFYLIKACFYPYRDDRIDNLKKTKEPQYYWKINK